jgi:multidrug efflux pump
LRSLRPTSPTRSASRTSFSAPGQIGQQPNAGQVELTFPVVTQPQFTDPNQYLNIILRASQDGNAIVRVGDVARAEVGLQQYIVDSKMNGVPATIIAVYQQPGANGLVVSAAVRKALEEMKSRFPQGMDYVIALDTNDFVRLSIKEVIKTLFEAMVLVVLVVYLFLQSFRTTIICSVAIVIALVATFAGMLALGFSINLLTLFGLVLAIGMVVDDAIVVVENVERNMHEHHLPPKEATIRSMDEIASSLVAVVLVMCSVFIPAAFLPGTTGQLYKQFAITIVISVSVSGFVALTVTPAMCAALLKHSPPPTRGPFAWFNRQVDRVTQAFGVAVAYVIKFAVVALVLLAVFLYSIFHLFKVLPTSFVPNEDQGYAFAAIIMPQAASLSRTQEIAAKADAIFKGLPGVETRTVVSGYSLLDSGFKTNAATIFVTFKDFDERYKSIDTAKQQNVRAILQGFFAQARMIDEAIVIPIAPPAIPGIGTTGGFEFWIQNTGTGDPVALGGVLQEFLKKARERPELTGLATTYSASTQQTAGQRRPRKDAAAGHPDPGCVQRNPGAVRLAHRQPVQHVVQRLVGGHPVGRAIPATPRRPDAAVYAQQPEPDGASVVGGVDGVDRGARPAAALQRLHRGQGQWQCVRGLQLGRRDRRDGGGRQGSAAG